MSDLDLPGLLRRIRRTADLSQREMARSTGTSRATIAAAEAGTRGLDARTLARLAAVAGLRLALVDADGAEVAPMDGAAVRDGGGRRFPAHLDTRHGDEGWWHGPHRYDRDPVTYTFTRVREHRDEQRARRGTPEDHQLPQPGDALADRAADRRAAARRAREEDLERRRAAGLLRSPVDLLCECPPACDDLLLEDLPPVPGRPGPHTDDCACSCDVS
ncbi:helix-turn-helix domain-containing protein [Geodermatophilus saharensis]|uniref:helix-turn-helix domain-containing protein n=1 Tax=Geodermatophilus saharensis TaxID=1137994 RepID=UPI0015951A15|nr:helix-turn-helix transcriptional regulator [Geodermatophilus saharensis]